MKHIVDIKKWMLNEGMGYSKKYKCWPTPEAFCFALSMFLEGTITRKQAKVLLEDMFQQASVNPKLAVYLDRQKRNMPGGSDD